MLTEYQHRNTEKTGYCRANQRRTSGPFATHWFPLHQIHAERVRRDLNSSSNERVDVNVTVKLAGVE